MTRKSFVQIDGVLYEKGTEPRRSEQRATAAVYGDLPDFVSPIDGTTVRGRAGMRDHCARHNVVPTADLAGLPSRPQATASRSERIEDIRRAMGHHGHY